MYVTLFVQTLTQGLVQRYGWSTPAHQRARISVIAEYIRTRMMDQWSRLLAQCTCTNKKLAFFSYSLLFCGYVFIVCTCCINYTTDVVIYKF